MDFPLTSGASRALERAARIAQSLGAGEVEPLPLLWGLLLDESRAAAILLRSGLTQERLHALHPLPEVANGTGTATLLPGSALDEVLLAAHHHATGTGEAEIGSEHLLAGLSKIDSAARTVLRDHGLAGESPIVAPVSTPLPTDETVWTAAPAADLTDTHRILDAAANRLREGLRVLEDYVRFSLDDRHLTEVLKTWRHNFTAAFQIVNADALLAARDTRGDVGTGVKTAREHQRGSLLDVVRAAFKRVQEAVRTLEECGKVLDAALGKRLELLRYELYTLEKAVLRTHSARERLGGCRLYLLLTEELCLRGSGPTLRSAMAGGVEIVQVREKRMADRDLLEHARRVRKWTSDAGVLLVMNDRPDLAVLAEADGVHVGQEELSVRDARRIVGPDRLVGVSTHTLEQARQAVLDGADYIGVGPVFPSGTKTFSELAGLEFVRQVSAEITLPAFAIGGITGDNIAQVTAAGATRVAVSGSICRSEDPASAARQLRSTLSP